MPWSTICASRTFTTASWLAGAFVDQRLRGLVEGRKTRDPRFVEVSLVVEPAWRGRGLGQRFWKLPSAGAEP